MTQFLFTANAQPEKCPKCGSEDIEFLKDWDELDGSHVQDFRCLDCGAEWDVYFQFERWEMKIKHD